MPVCHMPAQQAAAASLLELPAELCRHAPTPAWFEDEDLQDDDDGTNACSLACILYLQLRTPHCRITYALARHSAGAVRLITFSV